MKKNIGYCSFITLIFLLLLTSCGKNEVTNITLNLTSATFTVGQIDTLVSKLTATGDLTKNPVTWKTSNSAVATVTNGVVTALKTGETTITVQAGGKSATCAITVVDQISPALTQGILAYYGDIYGTTTDSLYNLQSNNFVLYLANSNVDLNNYLSGTADRLMLEINTDTTYVDSIPSGTYDMMTGLVQNQLIPYSIVPAYKYAGNPWGTWYFGYSSNPIGYGNIVVKRSNDFYNIQYNLIDYYGNTITGTFNGALIYYNGTTTQSGSPAFKNTTKNFELFKTTKSFKIKRK
ncbi:MAG: Ig-like domain-containing protein [Paludibacter sp.]|nr:Ig-like domain-containing protein [Paludibacter sp.]